MTLKTLFCFLILFTLTRSLNILFVLPCYGGHFGAMSNLVAPFARRHQVTVIATSPLCEKKFTPIQKLAGIMFPSPWHISKEKFSLSR